MGILSLAILVIQVVNFESGLPLVESGMETEVIYHSISICRYASDMETEMEKGKWKWGFCPTQSTFDTTRVRRSVARRARITE